MKPSTLQLFIFHHDLEHDVYRLHFAHHDEDGAGMVEVGVGCYTTDCARIIRAGLAKMGYTRTYLHVDATQTVTGYWQGKGDVDALAKDAKAAVGIADDQMTELLQKAAIFDQELDEVLRRVNRLHQRETPLY